MDAFKVPSAIPQDLLLIQELIGPQPTPRPAEPAQPTPVDAAIQKQAQNDEDINSSDDEDRLSEEEIAANLIAAGSDDEEMASGGAENKPLTDSSVGDSSSSSESDSDSDSDSDEEQVKKPAAKAAPAEADDDDDEDGPGPSAANNYFQTKHEVAEVDIPIPDIDEVGADEVLEQVGEVMNILDNVVIIRGLVRGSDKALDSDTLLVFDDRKVMGYIYETFGPTTQPLYQVKFNSKFPLDQERVRVGREVFHVPARSNFVFVSQIKAFKGSDASNVYDEEPGEDEVEFSDDEAEAAHRSRLKRKRGESRSRSVAPSGASSRASTPNPTLMRDQELADEAVLTRGAFDEYSPYDVDYSMPGPSRPAPMPYDDPYGDAYTAPDLDEPSRPAGVAGGAPTPASRPEPQSYDRPAPTAPSRGGREFDGRGRGRDRGRGGRGGGRERGRGRGGAADHRGGRQHHQQQQYGGNMQHGQQQHRAQYGSDTAYPDDYEGSLSPSSYGGGGTGGYQPRQPQQQYQQQSYYNQQQQYGQFSSNDAQQWAYAQQQFMPQFGGGGLGGYMNQGYQYPAQGGGGGGYGMPAAVQPHINPRFASAFSFGMPQMQQSQGQGGHSHGQGHSHSQARTASAHQGEQGAVTPTASAGSVSSLSEWTVPLQSASANGSAASSRAPSANPNDGN